MVNWRKVRLWLLLYVAFDFFFGGINGGFFTLTPLAAAQFTTTTGTVTDPNGVPYANGTITATLITSASPTLSGLPYTPPTQPVGLNAVGAFVMQLADNTQLSPGGTQWQFKACSAAGTVQPAGGNGPVCFITAAITISGASQDISAQLQIAALPLSSNTATPIFSAAVAGTSMATAGINAVLVGPVTMTTPGAAGTYRLVFQVLETVAGSGGTCAAGTIGIAVSYKDADTAVTYSLTANNPIMMFYPFGGTTNTAVLQMTSGAPFATNNWQGIPREFRAASGTAIQYEVTQQTNSNCTTPPVFTVRPALYRLGY